MRFVIDTNIIISSTMLADSVPAKALTKAEDSGIILYSEDTLSELLQVLGRPKLSPYIKDGAIAEFYARIRMNWHFVPILQHVQDCRDDKDNKFLELALNGNADILISGDNDLLILNPYRKISIITPASFMNTIIQSST